MDILNNFTNSTERDIIISLPQDKTWVEYLSCFNELNIKVETLDIIVGTLPKTQPGRKCYFIFEGLLRGYMIIQKISETEEQDFSISLLPNLYSTTHKIPMEEIDDEDFKYYFDNSNTQ